MAWCPGNFQSWNISTASLRTTVLHCDELKVVVSVSDQGRAV